MRVVGRRKAMAVGFAEHPHGFAGAFVHVIAGDPDEIRICGIVFDDGLGGVRFRQKLVVEQVSHKLAEGGSRGRLIERRGLRDRRERREVHACQRGGLVGIVGRARDLCRRSDCPPGSLWRNITAIAVEAAVRRAPLTAVVKPRAPYASAEKPIEQALGASVGRSDSKHRR